MIKKINLKKPPKGLTRPGHPWVYRSQIQFPPGSIVPGDLVDIYTERDRFVGRGYINPHSEISVRLLSRQAVPIDRDFFSERFRRAAAFRARFVKDTNAYRLVSSEGDDLPGLVIDRYGEVLVVQFLTAGMERLRPIVLEALEQAVPNRGVYERSDAPSRKFEGLVERTGWVRKDCGDEIRVIENGIETAVDLAAGHKTGSYLDQRENRAILAGLGVGRALDAFCYEGGFSLALAKAGARVVAVDAQVEAIRRAEAHRKRNGLPESSIEFRVANVFDELKTLEKAHEKFDLVILDPPSFVKNKAAIEGAMSGYKEILLRSMKLLSEDGLLAVFSCSYHVDDRLLMQASLSAALDTQKKLRLMRFLKQSNDHPVNPFIPETLYLKGFLFTVASA